MIFRAISPQIEAKIPNCADALIFASSPMFCYSVSMCANFEAVSALYIGMSCYHFFAMSYVFSSGDTMMKSTGAKPSLCEFNKFHESMFNDSLYGVLIVRTAAIIN